MAAHLQDLEVSSWYCFQSLGLGIQIARARAGLSAVLKVWNLNSAVPFSGRAKERWAVMKMHAVLLPLVTLLCLLLAMPAMAGPIPFSAPSGDISMTDSVGGFGFPGPDVLSMLSSENPTGPGLSAGSIGSPLTLPSPGSYRLVGFGGGPPDPPTPAPASEPSGIVMVLSSGLLGVLGLCRRNLKV